MKNTDKIYKINYIAEKNEIIIIYYDEDMKKSETIIDYSKLTVRQLKFFTKKMIEIHNLSNEINEIKV